MLVLFSRCWRLVSLISVVVFIVLESVIADFGSCFRAFRCYVHCRWELFPLILMLFSVVLKLWPLLLEVVFTNLACGV